MPIVLFFSVISMIIGNFDMSTKIDKKYKVGDIVNFEIMPKDFGRIAAQTARQVITQKIREASRDVIFNEFADKKGEIITGRNGMGKESRRLFKISFYSGCVLMVAASILAISRILMPWPLLAVLLVPTAIITIISLVKMRYGTRQGFTVQKQMARMNR